MYEQEHDPCLCTSVDEIDPLPIVVTGSGHELLNANLTFR